MRPEVWRPPVEPSPAEQAVIKAVRRAKLFVFLREHRHELFDEQFQAELAEAYVDSPKGQPPVPPARLALETILQAYTKVSDDEVIEATVMDRRWQLVLDCMGAEEPPFAKGTLVGFRKRLIEGNLGRRLIERTVALAARTGGFGARALRAALDSSPLWGAGRVEDTINLMGHALRTALDVIAVLQGRGGPQEPPPLRRRPGRRSWPPPARKQRWTGTGMTPAARDEALAVVLGLLDRVEAFAAGLAGDQAAAAAVAAARQVRGQDVDLTGQAPVLRRGVAKEQSTSACTARRQEPMEMFASSSEPLYQSLPGCEPMVTGAVLEIEPMVAGVVKVWPSTVSSMSEAVFTQVIVCQLPSFSAGPAWISTWLLDPMNPHEACPDCWNSILYSPPAVVESPLRIRSQSSGGGGGVPVVLRWIVKLKFALPGFMLAADGTDT